MPPVFLHMALAKDIQDRVGHPTLEAQRGTFYLGATTPDIRVLTRWDRARTHYFRLETLEHQDSVAAFLEENRHLKQPEALDAATLAFVVGYVSHLVLDERWIQAVYRPYFGQLSALGGDLRANVMDRLLQFELERRRRCDDGCRDHLCQELERAEIAVNIGFLDSETLSRWRQIAVDIARQPPDWELFQRTASRHLRAAGIESEAAFREFMEQVPDLLDQAIRHVSAAQVDAFLEESTEASVAFIERYLGCA